ncbi:MAG: phosphoenolpyruvate synthase [Fimbriimonadaceae bacterium]|nr:phosphoenolpyruvate synthase [Chitinophagales bacterium]
MQFIFSNDIITQKTKNELGGKAFNLFELLKLNICVPKFVVIPNSFLQNIIISKSGNNDIIINTIEQFGFSEPDLSPLKKYFEETTLFAVRSSGIDEDGNDNSFAGQFETKLYVPFSELQAAIKEVWLSAYSKRVLQYRKNNQISGKSGIAIIIQQMINADSAGVAFGINPLNNNANEKVINAVYGLGEGLVSGYLDADQYIVSKDSINKTLAEKKEKFVFDEGKRSGTKIIAIENDQINNSVLAETQIHLITKLLDTLNQHFNFPQDIEFAFENNQLYLLQTRPVTALNQTTEKDNEIIWDNSNIIESYPGLTSPLTFSFITKMYEAVYRQLSAVLGISKNKIDAHAQVYANMLGLLKGRVYYNLNSWYISLSLLPGYSVNAAFMEKMMGVKEKFPVTIEKKKSGIKDYLEIVNAITGILRNLFVIEKQRKSFQKHFDSVMLEYDALNFENCSSTELMQYYLKFEQILVKKWKAPLVNDFFAMIFFGLLQKQLQKSGSDENENLHNDLLSGSKDIISTQPIELTLKIADLIRADNKTKNLFENNSPQEIFIELKNPEFSEILLAINNYISYWGDRTVGELKLETTTYHQNPVAYIQIIKSYITNGVTFENYLNKGNPDIRSIAEIKVLSKIRSPFKRVFFKWILKKARYFVSNRENLRYQRTRGFGMVRKIFLAIGNRFSAQKITQQQRDIFYLTKEEIFDYIKGTSTQSDLKKLITLRKEEYAVFEAIQLPERINTKGIASLNLHEIKIQTEEKSVLSELKGIGCCAGIVKGKLRIIKNPDEIESLNGDILVTSSTDPGWVTLFPTCSAILVERGSLLSHSAIVSRELGIPCIVGIKNLLQIVETGMIVEMDGSTGVIKIIQN